MSLARTILLGALVGAASAAAGRPAGGPWQALTFERWGGFNYSSPKLPWHVEPRPGEQWVSVIPARQQALNGQAVRLQGFMVPLDVDKGRVRRLGLVRSLEECCSVGSASLNQWVLVDVAPGLKVPDKDGMAVTLYGRLGVGDIEDHRIVLGIYRLELEAWEPGAPGSHGAKAP